MMLISEMVRKLQEPESLSSLGSDELRQLIETLCLEENLRENNKRQLAED